MNQKGQSLCWFHIGFTIIFVAGLCLTSCTLKDPVSVQKETGHITGRVFPLGASVTVAAIQGATELRTAETDSAGYFVLSNLKAGVYSLNFSAENYGKIREDNITVYDGATTALKDVFLKAYPEQISDCRPRNGQINFPLNEAIIIEFTNSMDEASVENAFSVFPKTQGQIFWNLDATKLTFAPQTEFQTSTKYSVVISSLAKTQYGIPLSFPFSLAFYSAPLQVTRSYPAVGASGVSTSSNIVLYFNSAVNQNSFKQSLTINPEIIGDFNWINNKTVQLSPGHLLEPESDYLISLDSLVSDAFQNNMNARYLLYFSTEKTRVLNYSPQNGANYVPASGNIIITFNAEMDQLSVEAALKIAPSTAGTVKWYNFSSLRFIPNNNLLPDTEYRIKATTNCRTLSGKYLADELKFSFTTSP